MINPFDSYPEDTEKDTEKETEAIELIPISEEENLANLESLLSAGQQWIQEQIPQQAANAISHSDVSASSVYSSFEFNSDYSIVLSFQSKKAVANFRAYLQVYRTRREARLKSLGTPSHMSNAMIASEILEIKPTGEHIVKFFLTDKTSRRKYAVKEVKSFDL